MNCPTCNSTDCKKSHLVYETNTSIGSFSGVGTAIGEVGLAGGTSRSQTLLASRVAPPKSYNISAPGVVISVVGAGMILLGASGDEQSNLLIYFGAAVCGIGCLLLISGNKKAGIYAQEMDEWRNTWICLSCGKQWQPNSASYKDWKSKRDNQKLTPVEDPVDKWAREHPEEADQSSE